jgi:O-antigen/teichoic acid export membrane protein
LSEAVDGVISPSASALRARQDVDRFLKSSLKTAFAIALLTIGYGLVAPLMMPMVFGEAYQAGIFVAMILCARSSVLILSSPFTWVSYNFDYAKSQWITRLLQGFNMVALNVGLLSIFGIFAPAIAWLAFELIGFFGVAFFLLLSMHRTRAK